MEQIENWDVALITSSTKSKYVYIELYKFHLTVLFFT